MDVNIVEVAEFEDVGMDGLRLSEVLGGGEGLEEEREGVVVGEDGVAVHVGEDGEWGEGVMVVVGVGEGSDEGVEDENVGSGDEEGEEKQSGVEEVVRLACGDEVVSDGGV